MWIMTKSGWVELQPRTIELPGHTPSLLERIGITPKYDAIATMADYCNSEGKASYFTFRKDGSFYQSRPAINPLAGMYGED